MWMCQVWMMQGMLFVVQLFVLYDVLFGCKDSGVGMLDGMMFIVCDLVDLIDVLVVLLLGFVVLLFVVGVYDEQLFGFVFGQIYGIYVFVQNVYGFVIVDMYVVYE